MKPTVSTRHVYMDNYTSVRAHLLHNRRVHLLCQFNSMNFNIVFKWYINLIVHWKHLPLMLTDYIRTVNDCCLNSDKLQLYLHGCEFTRQWPMCPKRRHLATIIWLLHMDTTTSIQYGWTPSPMSFITTGCHSLFLRISAPSVVRIPTPSDFRPSPWTQSPRSMLIQRNVCLL